MKNYIRNISRIFIALVMLSGGNFAYALAHGDCIINSNGHQTCEMECCKESDCCKDDSKTVLIKDVGNSCCVVHTEQSLEQDYRMPIISQKPELAKAFFNTIDVTDNISTSIRYIQVSHKFITTNIFLTVSNLRI